MPVSMCFRSSAAPPVVIAPKICALKEAVFSFVFAISRLMSSSFCVLLALSKAANLFKQSTQPLPDLLPNNGNPIFLRCSMAEYRQISEQACLLSSLETQALCLHAYSQTRPDNLHRHTSLWRLFLKEN